MASPSFYNKDICKITNRGITSFILDFERKFMEGFQFVTGLCNHNTVNIRIRFGESVSECNSDVNKSNGNASAK